MIITIMCIYNKDYSEYNIYITIIFLLYADFNITLAHILFIYNLFYI